MTIAYGNRRWAAGSVLGVAVIAAALLAPVGSVALALALGAVAGAALFYRTSDPGHPPNDIQDPLYRARVELARARRRDEEVDVLVAAFDPAVSPRPAELVGAFRITDGVGIIHRAGLLEVCAVVPKSDDARSAIELRLTEIASTQPVFAWATFPVDGVTLDALFARARELSVVHPGRTEPLVGRPRVRARAAMGLKDGLSGEPRRRSGWGARWFDPGDATTASESAAAAQSGTTQDSGQQ